MFFLPQLIRREYRSNHFFFPESLIHDSIFSYFRAEHRKHNYPIIWHIANIVLGRLFDTLFICLHWNIEFRIMQIFANHTLSRGFL